jgi:fructan beta-fructosidase
MSNPAIRRNKVAAVCVAALALGLVAAPSVAAQSSGAATSSAQVYHEPYRPQFHYTPKQNWMNDPNGPIFYKGQYHLFYQYNPSGNQWGNMSWGHAVSKDLVSWTELPLAIPKDDDGLIFSGSVVNDKTNSSGLGTADNPPLVAIYTHALNNGVQQQALAASTDGGLTWTKYSGNSVLDLNSSHDFRDPKVFWHEATHRWVMAVALSADHKISIYSSADLKTWTHESDFGPAGATGGVWETPALVPLKVDGNPRNVKWVLTVGINPGGVQGGSGNQYFVGSFDGKTFTSDDTGSYTPPAGTDLATFDGGSYDPWTTDGTAFGAGPATAPLPGQSAVDGTVGAGFVDSFNGGDGSIGTLTSPQFPITDRYLNFKVGGGDHPHVDGAVINPPTPTGPVFADFEGATWGEGWTATGDLAGAAPAAGTIGDQQVVSGYLGEKLVNTFLDHDQSTGTITSPAFTVTSNYIDLLVGGGNHPYTGASFNPGEGPTAVNLIVNGTVVKTTTGSNNETLDWASLDVSALRGQQAQIQIVDQNTGGWGHINVDNIVFADRAASTRNIETAVNLLVDGQVVKSATGSNSETLDWASFDLAAYQGKTAQIQISDQNTGGWGHLNADQFGFAAAPALSSVQRARWMDWGADFYAATTVNDAPGGKQIAIGWMNNWNYGQSIPTSPWRSAMSLPREMGLKTINGRVQLTQQPVDALNKLHTGRPVIAASKRITGTTPTGITGSTLDLTAAFSPGTAKQFGINVHVGNGQQTQIGYDTTTGEVYIDRTKSGNVAFDSTFPAVHRAPLPLTHGTLRLRVLVDTSSVEVFTDQGQIVLTDQIFPDATSNGVTLFANNGTAKLIGGVGRQVKSIWP